jgi:hypothetical protein
MARKAYGDHATQVNLSNYPDDGTSPVGSAEWNESLDNEGMLGFTPQTANSSTIIIASGVATITDSVSVIAGESAATDTLQKLAITNTSEYDLVYLFAASSGYVVTLEHGDLNADGEISTVSGSDEALSTTKPTILIRKGAHWYGYGGGSASNLTTSSLAAATLVTESEGIGSNDNDTTLPTSAAVKDYVDTQVATEDTITELNDTTISGIASGELLKWNGSAWINQTLAESGIAASGAKLSDFAATTSAELAGTISDETGSGTLVFATSPTLVTPALGTPSALVGTSITGTASGLTAGNVTTNANLTGEVTSSGNTATIANDIIQEGNLQVSNAPTNGQVLTARSGVTGGYTWEAAAGGFVALADDDLNFAGAHDIHDLQRASFEIQLNNFDDAAQIANGAINDDLTGESQVYVKIIDSNNDGVFARLKKNGSIVNVQLA